MFEFTLNGKPISAKQDKSLLEYLRDDARLTSVKDGCSEGACGTCTVLVDGKASRACIFKLSKLAGKEILTIEGLSQRERDVYAYAFAQCGAVQCGFCIPGMIISAAGLIRVNQSPTGADIKKAIRGNICRCTGYVKIEEAIMLAANMLREQAPIPKAGTDASIGADYQRLDAYEKALGTGEYTDDVVVPGMIFGKALRTPHPRAKILSIDTSAAKAHPDCVTAITAADIPGDPKVGHLVQDWDAMIGVGDITRYVGDSVALVAATKKESLNEILALIKVEYEVLKPITCPREGLAEGAPKIHPNGNILRHEVVHRGDPDKAMAAAKHVVSHTYSTPFTEHACMEPECAVAMPDPNCEGGILMYTGSQSVYDEQRETAKLIGLPVEKVRVISKLVGGGFGGKEDMSVQHHAGLLALITQKPVKIKFSRQESINIHSKRHAMEIEMTTGCDEKGNIVALKATIISDTGAYASLGGPVLQRACTHAAGPYKIPNVHIEGTAVYTNNPPAGAFRGFGVTQTVFASENNLNLLAKKVGLSQWEIRYQNAVKPGDVLPNGQTCDNATSLIECLLKVKAVFEQNPYAGIATSFKNSGLGVGVPDRGRCIVSVEGGKVHVRTSAACIGQGMTTVSLQMACQTLGLAHDMFVIEQPDTARTPNSGTTTASRQTLFTGEAVRQAALSLKAALDGGETLVSLEGKEFYGEYLGVTDPIGTDKDNPISHIAYGYAAQVVVLDESGMLKKVVAAYDVGRVVNPRSAQGQIEGGIAMGLGYALTEDYPLIDCIPQAKYGTLGLFRSTDMPEIETIIVEPNYFSDLAYGAKGVGELATIPTAPAVSAAYYRLDGKHRVKLPLNETKYSKK